MKVPADDSRDPSEQRNGSGPRYLLTWRSSLGNGFPERTDRTLEHFANAELPFGSFQQFSAEAYAIAFLLQVDGLFDWVRSYFNLGKMHAGPDVSGYRLTRISRAATNCNRHKSEWRGDKDVEVLASIGIDAERQNVPIAMLRFLGDGEYFVFEDHLTASVLELLRTADSPKH